MTDLDNLTAVLTSFVNQELLSWDIGVVGQGGDLESKNLEVKSYEDAFGLSHGYLSGIGKHTLQEISFVEISDWASSQIRGSKNSEHLLRILVFFGALSVSHEWEVFVDNEILLETDKKQRTELYQTFITAVNNTAVILPERSAIAISENQLEYDYQYWNFEARYHPIVRLMEKFTWMPARGELSYTISELKPFWFAAYVAHARKLNILLDSDLDLIIPGLDSDDVAIKSAFILNHLRDDDCRAVGYKTIHDLVSKNWYRVGRAVFRRVYGNVRNFGKEIDFGPYRDAVRNYVRGISSHSAEMFEWPRDWQAFAGFILEAQEKEDAQMAELLNPLWETLGKSLLRDWKTLKMEDLMKVAGKSFLELSEVQSGKSQVSTVLAIHSILRSAETDWVEWQKHLNQVFIALKPYCYSAGVLYQVRRTLAEILLLLLSVDNGPEMEDRELSRLKNLLSTFKRNLLCSGLAILEMEEDIWNPERLYTLKQWHNPDLYLVISRMKSLVNKATPDIKAAYGEFFEAWNNYAKTSWPTMLDNKWNILSETENST